MKTWQIWTGVGASAVILATVALTVATWNNIDSEWANEGAAAQYALNHSPLNKLISHDVFTGAGNEEVFSGYDVFGRQWYAFVAGVPFEVASVPAYGILSEPKVKSLIERSHHIQVKSLHIGYLDNATAQLFHTKSVVVWEAYGSNESNENKNDYVYVDAYTGLVVWPPSYS